MAAVPRRVAKGCTRRRRISQNTHTRCDPRSLYGPRPTVSCRRPATPWNVRCGSGEARVSRWIPVRAATLSRCGFAYVAYMCPCDACTPSASPPSLCWPRAVVPAPWLEIWAACCVDARVCNVDPSSAPDVHASSHRISGVAAPRHRPVLACFRCRIWPVHATPVGSGQCARPGALPTHPQWPRGPCAAQQSIPACVWAALRRRRHEPQI